MTPQQAKKLKRWIPAGYISLVQSRMTDAGHAIPSQPFISNVKTGRKQHDVIEAILLDLVREERAKAEAKAKAIETLTA